MQKTYRLSINMWALDTDADHILHRIGSKDYSEIRHTIVKDPEEWEEIAVADIRAAEQAREAKATYKSRVISLIRQRYDNDEETATPAARPKTRRVCRIQYLRRAVQSSGKA